MARQSGQSTQKKVRQAESTDTLNDLSTSNADERIAAVASEVFDIEELKSDQVLTIEHILDGDDVLVTQGTGWGKSVCFQIPGLLLAEEGAVVVIQPLIALMRDQTNKLRERGIQVACLDSLQSQARRDQEAQLAQDPETKLIYVSPEKFSTKGFQKLIEGRKISRLVVDEAHCISMWGHDFRPAYLRIPEYREKIGSPPLACFTATAPALVRDEILDMLSIPHAAQITGNMDRPNLTYVREAVSSEFEKEQKLIKEIKKAIRGDKPTIVYCDRVKTVEDLCERLQKDYRISSRPYHAKMDPEARRESHELFMGGICNLLIATKAFGMGIDKPDIRTIIHYGLPNSLEDYYQEAGRAGRDGKKSRCVLMYSRQDLRRRYKFVNQGNPSVEEVAWQYFKLWKRLSDDKLEKTVPVLYFDEEDYLKSFGSRIPTLESKFRSSVALMEEYGLIYREGRKIAFLVRGDEIDEDDFPISENIIEAKRQREKLRLQVLLHYAQTKEDPRDVILDHFVHNTVVDKIQRFPYRLLETVPEEHIKAILSAVRTQDMDRTTLSSIARGKGTSKNAFADLVGAMKGLSPQELRSEIEVIAASGYLRVVKAGDKSVVTLTASGKEYLEELDIEVPQITTAQQLKARIHSEEATKILRTTLKEWFEAQRVSVGKPSDWWDSMTFFQTEEFDFFGTTLTGRQLIETYYMRTYTRAKSKNPIKGHTKDFLNLLFNNKIKTDWNGQ